MDKVEDANTLGRSVQDVRAADKIYSSATASSDKLDFEKYLNNIYSDDLIDIHGSGWIYKKKESIELSLNRLSLPKMPILSDKREVISISEISDGVVCVAEFRETYYETPDPQALAQAAGTLTGSLDARRRAARRMADHPAMWPGEKLADNPLRTRTTRIWARRDNCWKIVLMQTTRVGMRTLAGLPLL